MAIAHGAPRTCGRLSVATYCASLANFEKLGIKYETAVRAANVKDDRLEGRIAELLLRLPEETPE